MTSKNPSIILVRPQLPENIGMVARVMHNFGLKDLIVVSPRNNWLNNKSINAAKKATKIINNIKVYDDLEIALSNFSYVVATTNRKRYLEKNSTNTHWTTIGVSPNIIDASYSAIFDSITFKLFNDLKNKN